MCSFLWPSNIPLCICTTSSLSIHLSTDIYVLAIVNSTAMNNGVQVSFWFPRGIYLGVELLGHVVVLFVVFKGISIPSSIMVVSIYIPTNSTKGFPFLHILCSIYCCRLFDDGHSDWCEVISHCSFDSHFSNNKE